MGVSSKKPVPAAERATRDVPARPSWPALEPLGPREDLQLHDILPGQIVTVSSFWTATLCKKYVEFLSKLPLTTTSTKPKRGEAVRVNDRFQIDDAAFANDLWVKTGLRELILTPSGDDVETDDRKRWGGEVIGLNPNVRIYRYKEGQYFDQHYDDSNNITIPADPPVLAQTTWTLLLYLTSSTTGCKGGETVFYPEPQKTGKKNRKSESAPDPIAVSPEIGMLLLHRHGKDCMVHEGKEVLQGEKWIIRTDLCVRR